MLLRAGGSSKNDSSLAKGRQEAALVGAPVQACSRRSSVLMQPSVVVFVARPHDSSAGTDGVRHNNGCHRCAALVCFGFRFVDP